MTIIKSTASVLVLLLFSIIIGLSVQAQPQANRNSTRQVGNILQRLERSTSTFRNRFAGLLESVRMLNGDTIEVNNEGGAQGDNQTTQTIQRTGIGTAVGAVIGAIAGGGKGAAIGGLIGAAGGAGSVFVKGKDKLELPSGTELTIRSAGPR